MSVARRQLYIYYRVAQPHWRDAANAVSAWQQQLRLTHPALSARVLRRPDEQDEAVTLMETYTHDHAAGSIDTALQAELARGAPALRPWLIGERHVESFDTLD